MGRSSSSSSSSSSTTTTRRRTKSSSSNLSVASILLLFLALSFLLVFPGFLLEAQGMVEPQRYHAGGHHGSNVGHHGINKGHHAHRSGSAAPGTGLRQSQCPGACAYRCSKAFTNKACKFFCNKCCNKCLCVPPGTYGNKEVCPCYNNWKTQQGGPKCP